MHFEFELTENDLLEYNYFINKRRSKKNKNATYIILGVLGLYILFFLYKQIQQGSSIEFAGLLVFIVLLAYFLTRKIKNPIKEAVKKSINNNPELIGHRKINLSSSELVYSTPNIESKHLLASFIRIEDSDEHLYLFNGETTALIIPKQSFTSTEEYLRFKKFIEKHMVK